MDICDGAEKEPLHEGMGIDPLAWAKSRGFVWKRSFQKKRTISLSSVLSHLPFPRAARGKLSIRALAAIGSQKVDLEPEFP